MKKIAESIDCCASEAEALSLVDAKFERDLVSIVSFVNAHACNLAINSEDFEESLLKSDVLLRDGIGTKVMLHVFGKKVGYNANGTDFIPSLLAAYKELEIAFVGTTDKYVTDAADKYKAKGTKVIAQLNGFHNNEEMLEFVRVNRPKIVVLGMGMPKQEAFSMYLKQHYVGQLLVINGGAIFDFIAGRFQRAPKLMQKLGLEWLFRLLNEPIRLFKRYVIGIPVFLAQVVIERFLK